MEKLNSSINAAKASHETTVKELQKDHAAVLASHVQQMETSYANIHQQLHQRMTAVCEKKDAEIAALNNATAEKIANVQKMWEEKVTALTEQLTAEKAAQADHYEDTYRHTIEQHTAALASVEEIWSERYAQVRQKAEKAVTALHSYKQKFKNTQREDLELLEARGKETTNLMEQAMKLIRQAQDEKLADRCRLRTVDDDPLPPTIVEKENDLPSPSRIRASYAAIKEPIIPSSARGRSTSLCPGGAAVNPSRLPVSARALVP